MHDEKMAMAEGGEKEGIFDEKKEKDDQNLWANILSEVQASSSKKLPATKYILVLGENESGKTTLIAKIQGTEDPKKGTGLEYTYINVRDEYKDEHAILGVYIMDGDPSLSHLLKFSLTEEDLDHTQVVICVAMTSPWNIVESLEAWSAILQDHIQSLKLSSEAFQEKQQKIVKRWQEYVEPGDELDGLTSPMRRSAVSIGNTEEDPTLLPLGDSILTRNLGLDIVVVVTKTDYMTNLEKEFDYKDEHFDFIQQTIRKFCLQHGASLFYTSVKDDKNTDLLLKYLVHRIYGFPFRTPALVVEKDAVFIPSGWDNEKKISILYENMTSMKPDEPYQDVIMKPITRKPLQKEAETNCEDDQIFLTRLQTMLNQQLPAQGSPRQDGVQKTPERRVSGTPSMPQSLSSPHKIDGTKGAPVGTGEGVLANFFNSLLSKKTGASPQGAIKTPDKSAVRSDAAAELDRMNRSKKSLPSQGNTPTSSPGAAS